MEEFIGFSNAFNVKCKSKKVLEIRGRDRSVITAKLCSMLCNIDSVQSSEISCTTSDQNGASPPTSYELSVLVGGEAPFWSHEAQDILQTFRSQIYRAGGKWYQIYRLLYEGFLLYF